MSRFPASRMPRPRLWLKKRTRFVPIPTPPAAMSRFGSRWCSHRRPASDAGRATCRILLAGQLPWHKPARWKALLTQPNLASSGNRTLFPF